MENRYRIILVVGDNHEEIVHKYTNIYYVYERCPQHRLEVTGEESSFSNPFLLKGDYISYSAHCNEIDWEAMMSNTEVINFNSDVWDVAHGAVPKDETLKHIASVMKDKREYFSNFSNKEEFVKYNTSLWYWGIIDESDCYHDSLVDDIPLKEWVVNFYDKFILPIKDKDPLLTIYEVKMI